MVLRKGRPRHFTGWVDQHFDVTHSGSDCLAPRFLDAGGRRRFARERADGSLHVGDEPTEDIATDQPLEGFPDSHDDPPDQALDVAFGVDRLSLFGGDLVTLDIERNLARVSASQHLREKLGQEFLAAVGHRLVVVHPPHPPVDRVVGIGALPHLGERRLVGHTQLGQGVMGKLVSDLQSVAVVEPAVVDRHGRLLDVGAHGLDPFGRQEGGAVLDALRRAARAAQQLRVVHPRQALEVHALGPAERRQHALDSGADLRVLDGRQVLVRAFSEGPDPLRA